MSSSTTVLRSSLLRVEQWHDYRPFGLRLNSGDGEEHPGCSLDVNAFGWYARIALPPLIRPHERRVKAKNWDAATVARLGRDYWIDYTPREYGFSVHEGFLQVFLGRQSHDSSTEQLWCCHFPWRDWRHVRLSLYDLQGFEFWTHNYDGTRGLDGYNEQREAEALCPKAIFRFKDFDGEEITATTHLEEREWRFGTKWCKWLSIFRRARIRRYLDISFSAETGRRKGSWKGGTLGHSIEVLPGELHESAFKRYCAQHEMAFIGRTFA